MNTLPFSAPRVVIGGVALLLLLRCSLPRDPAPVISRTVSGVDGFELRHRGFGNGLRFPGHFSLGYAVWANYPFVVYRGELYRRAGPGSVFITPAQGLSPRYVVEESALDTEQHLGYSHSRIEIVDRVSGDVLGYRTLRDGQVENGHGWTGQHAAEFVRQVLPTSAPIGGAVGIKPYGEAAAAFDTPADGDEDEDNGCPSSYRLDKGRDMTGLATGAWVFVAQSHIGSFACHGDYILVQAGYGNLLYLDLLTTDGRHVFQTDLHTPAGMDGPIALKRLRFVKPASGHAGIQVDVYGGAGRPMAARRLRATIQAPSGLDGA